MAGSRFCDLLQGQNAREFEGNRFYDSLPSGVSPSVWPSGVSPVVFLFLSFFAQWRFAQAGEPNPSPCGDERKFTVRLGPVVYWSIIIVLVELESPQWNLLHFICLAQAFQSRGRNMKTRQQ